jgi:4-hydroxythreonine-4-phosphate dehydrogenase
VTDPGKPKPIALTSGDPSGIGLDITLMSWLHRSDHALPPFAILADQTALQARAQQLGLDVPCTQINTIGETFSVFDQALPVLPIALPSSCEIGRPDISAAPAIIESIEKAVALTLTGHASAVVTNPIAKHILAAANFPHPGHTEFLGALAQGHGYSAHPVMMLAGAGLRVVPVTIHIALAEVPHALTAGKIIDTVRVVANDLKRWFGIASPRLVATGLNPHAGENGMMGMEEKTIIEPAIAALRAEGIDITGPYPADTLFHARARETYDAAIAMYHDQALLPLKTLAFDEGVNITLGLPFIRTSPDHGTAFGIAGTGKARPDSLIAALNLADQMARANVPALSSSAQ